MSGKILETLGENLNRDMVTDLLENGFYDNNFSFLINHMMEEEKHTSWRTAWVVVHLRIKMILKSKNILQRSLKELKVKMTDTKENSLK